jgi:acetylornithine deacetylase/succinyl-diaminopimelate desuccinylase-like protein
MTTPHEYARNHAEGYLQQLIEFVRIPSVSTDPAFQSEIYRAAQWLISNFQSAGLHTELIEMPGRHPLVYAEWMGAGQSARTVLFYGHYDVQPAIIEDGWDTPPFEPVIKDGFLYARGTTDDKGQLFTHIKAVESCLRMGNLPVNVKFIIEGEEESGGYHISQFVASHAEKLRADVCVVSDTSMHDITQPVIVNALRGGVGTQLTVYGPAQDLHSGMYGGTVHNPLVALAAIIARLHHPDGRVAVPGFYDDVQPLIPAERAQIAAVQMQTADWQAITGAPQPWGEPDFNLSERIGARPTLEITGMAGGYFGEGAKSIIPAKAWAKISCRLVANQDPADILSKLRAYIEQITPPTVRLEWQGGGGKAAVLVNTDTPAMTAAIRAYEKAWGYTPVFKREGGSIPIVADFQKIVGLPVILMGFGLDSDGLHGPNEHFSIEMFERGIQTSIQFLQEMAMLQ